MLVIGKSHGSEGVVACFDCKNGSCVSGSGSSSCGYYNGHSEKKFKGKEYCLIECHATDNMARSNIDMEETELQEFIWQSLKSNEVTT